MCVYVTYNECELLECVRCIIKYHLHILCRFVDLCTHGVQRSMNNYACPEEGGPGDEASAVLDRPQLVFTYNVHKI